jgi:regulator of cell morphogenesis and NO signaling
MPHPTINEIITEDYRAALILDSYGIDFCYSGDKTLEEVSEEQHLDQHILEQALSNLNALPPHWDYVVWDTKFLVEFIVHTHHNYIRETLPKLLLLADIVLTKDGQHHPEMHPIGKLLTGIDQRVKQHMISEEYALFPYLLEMEMARSNKQQFVAATNGRLVKPIQAIVKDHLKNAQALKEIRELSQHFQPPHSACKECLIWYQLLKEFDADMRLHIHLENNILFPRSLALEAELLEHKRDDSVGVV